ncbi:MAG: inovirus-type Gp2 protein [Rhodospirillales bacterium]|jgi:hypothetical protein|nr:inovirus-type Gp2 protein [Rhodospirillales bacterium]
MTYTYRDNMTNTIMDMIAYMRARYRRVQPIRLDIHFPKRGYYQDGSNDEIMNFFKNLHRHFSHHVIEMLYCATREQVSSHNPHYHVFILVDGDRHNGIWGVFEICCRIWITIIRKRLMEQGLTEEDIGNIDMTGLIHYRKEDTRYDLPKMEVMCWPNKSAEGEERDRQQRLSDQVADNVFKHAKYIAKDITKGQNPPGTRELFASRIPRAF